MKKIVLLFILVGIRYYAEAQNLEQQRSQLILSDVAPSLMYTLDPNEQIDSLGLIEAKIVKNNEGRFYK